MGRRLNTAVSGALMLGLLVAGCGGSSANGSGASTKPQASNATTPKKQEHVPTVSIVMSSPAFKPGKAIAARYTCDGANISPALRWTAIPKGTAELVLIISDLEGSAPGGGPLISWAVAGLQPTLRVIAAGTLPSGAIVGLNSFGQARYSVCPPKGSPAQPYLVAIYALPHPISTKPGFDAGELDKTMSSTAEYKGIAGFTYKRA